MMIQAAFSVRRVLAQDLLAARMHKGEAHAYEIADWSSSCRFCEGKMRRSLCGKPLGFRTPYIAYLRIWMPQWWRFGTLREEFVDFFILD